MPGTEAAGVVPSVGVMPGTEPAGALPDVGALPASEGETPSKAGVRMTSFAECKLLKVRSRKQLGPGRPPVAAQQDPTGEANGQPGPERLQLRQLLEEKRREIQAQIEAMQALNAQQWQRLGKRAFRGLMKGKGMGPGHPSSKPSLDKEAGPLLAERAVLRASEEPGPCDGGRDTRVNGSAVSDYKSTMGRLSRNLTAVQNELQRLSVCDPQVLPAWDNRQGQGTNQHRTRKGAGGCLIVMAEAEGPPPAGRQQPGDATDSGEQHDPSRSRPKGNAGEWKLPENDGRMAEQSEAENLARRRTLFLQHQQKRAQQVKLRRCQHKAGLRQNQEELRRNVSEEQIRAVEAKPGQGTGHRKQLLDTMAGRNESRAKTGRSPDGSAAGSGGSGVDSLQLEQPERFPDLTINRRTPAERNPTSTPPPAEQTGLRLYKELSGKSNRLILHNALSYCCLAGKANQSQRIQVLEELMHCEHNQCVILFRDNQCKFRALYSFSQDTEEIQRLWGMGPKLIAKDMIEALYKYNSDRKQFHIIPSKTMSASVDALTIHGHLWQGRKRVALSLAHR